MGCEKEVIFHESGRDLYYVDKNGEIFLLDDSKKIKVEQYIQSPDLLKNTINETNIVNWDGLDFKIDFLLKYIDGNCHYRITIKNNNSNKWIETDSYKRINDDTGTLLNIDLVEEDKFPIERINIEHNRDLTTNIVDGDETVGYRYVGKIIMSKNNFSKIRSINVLTQIGK